MDAREFVILLMVGLPAVSILVLVWGGLRLKALLARVPRIASKKDLDLYAAEHKLHDLLGTLIKGLLGVSNVLFVLDLFVLDGPLSDLFYSVAPSIVCILVSLPFRAIEQKANDLECANDDLRKDWNALRQSP
jgi:hypothetical protein